MPEEQLVREATLHMINKRYVLHDLMGIGGMGAVYRATDRLNGQAVALKRVTARADQLVFAAQSGNPDPSVALAQEFRMLASLHHPHVISVLDYGFDLEGQPFYTMDLLESPQTMVEAGLGQGLDTQVDLLVQALQALAYLHRRGILHRDLKPENVLAVEGRIKVLDFGVSVATSRTMEYVTQTTVGTVAYIAPELFKGAPVTRAADLYALGVMAYEMFAGVHPFDTSSVAVLLRDILYRAADVRSIGVSDGLAEVLARLLAKTREERYDDANQVIRDLCAALDRPLPPETAEIRESYLQAARFVGRKRELGQLSKALDAALTGQGAAWLVGGESGVGKSRLLDELRSLALVRGALVLRGYAVSEGGGPYRLWRDVLRWLVLSADPEGGDLGIFKEFVPDVADLVGHEVPDPPPLDPRALSNRLFRVVDRAIRRLCAVQPVVVILEDLHWAESGSMELLRRLAAIAPQLKLLIIATYRDDERSALPQELPGMQVLRLERLTEADIAELSESMVGAIGRDEQVVSLLQRETEGNPFFLVEVVRTLAEEAGRLAEIGHKPLPDKVFAGGVQQVIQRRLNRVPAQGRPLLQLAAVAGRELDLDVLSVLAPDVDLNAWLIACADVAVLEAQGVQWRFAHHKLRDGLLDALPDEVRPGLHRQVAEALEQISPGRIAERLELLAHHWEQARDMEKAIHYLLQAGDRARRLGASLDAVDSYRSALEKTAGLKGSEDEDGLHSIHELLGDVYFENLFRHEKALDHYTSFLALAESEADVARGERKVATIHLLSGNLTDAQQHFEAALAHLSALPPTAEASRVHSGLAYLFISRNQLDEADEQASAGLKLSCQIADTRGLADANKIKATIALQRGALEEARKYDERSLALYRQLGDLPRSAQACNNLGDTYRLLGQMGRATECLREGLKLARLVGDTRDEALLLQTTAELALDQGEWETAITHFEEALRLAEESGVVARVIDVHRSLGSAYERAGQLENARRHLEIAEISSLDTQHLRFVPWIYLDLACLNVSERAFGEAQRYIELAAQAAGPEPSDVFGGLWHRCFGYLQGCRGNGVDAVHHLEESLRLLEGAKLPAEVGKTRLELGVAYASRGRKSDRGRACEQLLMALSVFQQLEAQGYVAQVKGQLQKLGCRS